MSIVTFFVELFDHGHVHVDDGEPSFTPDEITELGRLLLDFEPTWRESLPAGVPAFSLSCSVWAGQLFYLAAQFACLRHIDRDRMKKGLAVPCPDADFCSMHYSVDIVFRFLPDLRRLVNAINEQDPLCEMIRNWGNQWPLSSVGMDEVKPDSTILQQIGQHPCLSRILADRQHRTAGYSPSSPRRSSFLYKTNE